MTIPRVLSIAGTDPTGGAGMHADLKSIAAVGGYGMSVVTSLVAQNTQGVRTVHTPPVSFLSEQLDAVADDVEIDAVKIGMLGDVETVRTVADWLASRRPPVVVLDPVMVATSGDRLLDRSAEDAVRDLIEQVDLVTPNSAELAVLNGSEEPGSWPEALELGRGLARRHGVRVLVKGGHIGGEDCPDALVESSGVPFEVAGPRIDTTTTHGTGCSMSSAMATLLAAHGNLRRALTEAKSWLIDAIRHGPELAVGTGNGPLHHFHALYADARRYAGDGSSDYRDSMGGAAGGGVAGADGVPAPAGVIPTAVTPSGPYTASLWHECEEIRREILDLPFIRDLAAGTLAASAFEFYTSQDGVYLREYARALARASQLAPTAEEQAFWAGCASATITEEPTAHQRETSVPEKRSAPDAATPAAEPATVGPAAAEPATVGPAAAGPATVEPATSDYIDLLSRAARHGYAAVAAAVLPCFWIYQDLAVQLGEPAATHPYRAWLQMYAGSDFQIATATAVGYTEQALAAADADERTAAAGFFAAAAGLERDFFAAPIDRRSQFVIE